MGTSELLEQPDKMLGSTLRWTSVTSRGSRNTPSRFMLQRPELRAARYELVGHIRLYLALLTFTTVNRKICVGPSRPLEVSRNSNQSFWSNRKPHFFFPFSPCGGENS